PALDPFLRCRLPQFSRVAPEPAVRLVSQMLSVCEMGVEHRNHQDFGCVWPFAGGEAGRIFRDVGDDATYFGFFVPWFASCLVFGAESFQDGIGASTGALHGTGEARQVSVATTLWNGLIGNRRCSISHQPMSTLT